MLYRDMKVYVFTYDPTTILTIDSQEDTVTVAGLDASRDVVINLIKPTVTTGASICNVRISADDTLAVEWTNPTAGSVNPASETYTLVVARSSSDPTANGDVL